MFRIGKELKLVVQNRPTFFNNLINSIRTFYDEKLIHAANWDDYQDVPFWSKFNYVGIESYFPLSSATTPFAEELVNVWQVKISELEHYKTQLNKDVILLK